MSGQAVVEPGLEPWLRGQHPPRGHDAASKPAGNTTVGTAIFNEDMKKSQILSQLSKGKVHFGKMQPNVFLNYMLSGRRNVGKLGAQRRTELTEENTLKDTFPVLGQPSWPLPYRPT